MKSWLKAQHSENEDHSIWSHHFMGNRWGNSGNSVRLYFWGLQNQHRWWCSHEIKRRLLLGRKVMTNLDSIFKSRDITLPTKVRLVKAMVFPVVTYGCESWTVKKAERLIWTELNTAEQEEKKELDFCLLEVALGVIKGIIVVEGGLWVWSCHTQLCSILPCDLESINNNSPYL